MPVSSPSYFPPQRTGDVIAGLNAGIGQIGSARIFLAMQAAGNKNAASDVIAIGENSAGGASSGMLSTTPPVVAIGTNALQNVIDKDSNASGGTVAIGYHAGATVVRTAADVLIGAQAGENYTNTAGLPSGSNVVIGCLAAQNVGNNPSFSGRLLNSVVAGARAAQLNSTNHIGGQVNASVIIGCEAANNNAAIANFPNIANHVIIGYQAAIAMGSLGIGQASVVIGYQTAQNLTAASGAVVLGPNIATDGSMTNSVAIGATVTCSVNADCVVIGGGAQISSSGAAHGAILLGAGAGIEYGNSYPSRLFLVEYQASGIYQAALAVNMANGNAVIGNSTLASGNRDITLGSWTGTNNFKLLNGTSGGATSPSGGGYFYVSAGSLHWVGSSGTDTQLAPA